MSSTSLSPLGWRAISFFWTNCWLHFVWRPGGTEQRPRQLSELEISIWGGCSLTQPSSYMHTSDLTSCWNSGWSFMLTINIQSPAIHRDSSVAPWLWCSPWLLTAALGITKLARVGHSWSGSVVCLRSLSCSSDCSVSACLLCLSLCCCSSVLCVMVPDCCKVLSILGRDGPKLSWRRRLSTSIGDSSCLQINFEILVFLQNSIYLCLTRSNFLGKSRLISSPARTSGCPSARLAPPDSPRPPAGRDWAVRRCG